MNRKQNYFELVQVVSFIGGPWDGKKIPVGAQAFGEAMFITADDGEGEFNGPGAVIAIYEIDDTHRVGFHDATYCEPEAWFARTT